MAGKTFSNSTGSGLTGTMVNRGQLNWNPTSSTTQTVQPGYYSGGTLNSAGAYNKGKTDGATQSKVGTAAPGQVLAGKTFTNSSTVGATGTMVNNEAWKNSPSTKGRITIPAGYHNGSGYVDTNGVYAQGVADGLAQALGNLNITYTYHQHEGNASSVGGCYINSEVLCRGTRYALEEGYESGEYLPNGDTIWKAQSTCTVCKILYYDLGVKQQHPGQEFGICNAATNTIVLGCGKTTSTIESATIKY